MRLSLPLAFLFAIILPNPQMHFATAPAVTQEAKASSTSGNGGVAYPLRPSPNGRYLVDQNDVPFMIVGDSPQALIGNLSISDAAWYMKNRARYGINTLWINLLCNQGTACNADGTTFDGIAPFKVAGDLSTPNPAYFQRVHDMIALAAANDMLVLLDPAETRGWLSVLRANGIAKARNYGAFLGNHYRRFPNIIWMHGNDFQSWRNLADDALVRAVASGIQGADPSHLHTIELNYLWSASLDDSAWAPSIGLDAVYTYYPTYALLLTEYNRKPHLPTFTVEANYEFEHNSGTDGGSPANLRRQEYWTMLSGATGGLYGNAYSWTFYTGWRDHMDTPGVLQLSYMRRLFIGRKWFDLVPDQDHTTVTAGYGKFYPRGTISQNTYVTAARTGDGSLVMAYIPSEGTLTIDMTRLAGAATARWYDPTNGTYRTVSASPLVSSGSRQFATPGKNAAGDGDWVLLLETSPPPDGQVD